MADVIRKATNKFTKGLVMDFSPENTGNDVLTHALNATLLTFNGNELSLQNDMGNGRVETAFLPEGYIPVGTCEYGGIIYIVSYNPLEDKSQIGCFPSPERNISNDELGISDAIIPKDSFQYYNYDNSGIPISPTGEIKHFSHQVLLKNDKLNPGDKFIIKSNKEICDERLKDLWKKNSNSNEFELVENPMISLNIVSIEDSGKIIYLNSDVRQYDNIQYNNETYKYHILGSGLIDNENYKKDIDEYRTVLSSGYNVFKSKTSGKLAILAELITIDSYSVTHDVEKTNDKYTYNINLYPEIFPDITNDSQKIIPKLKYHYLEKSQGYLQCYNSSDDTIINKELFNSDSNKKINDTPLSSVYKIITRGKENELDGKHFSNNNFNFPEKDNYALAINDNKYKSKINLGTIEFPEIIIDNAWNLPFKYDYTLVPCMEYGKLQHLAVSNTIDFSNMRNFDKSNFNVWKYRIDGSELRLTFGTQIYDTFEENKVDALILEFYDYRGFAGSLEISGKKAYSGIFTKLISLNTLNAISNKKINSESSGYTTDYKRNINISKKDNEYSFNNIPVTYIDNDKGWNIDDSDNDCGTLYSNILYGVKPYLRRTNSDGSFEFIKKGEFFLFTLPIYNDCYYKYENFNVLEKPKLDIVLTYKLEEDVSQSKLESYNDSDNNINNGYNINDEVNINNYLSNKYIDTELSAIKYYKYSGVSKLNIEIGLRKEYSDFGLTYNPEINKHFDCTLKLLSNDENKEYTVSHNKSNELIPDILNGAENFDSNITLSKSELKRRTFSEKIDNTVRFSYVKCTNDRMDVVYYVEENTFIGRLKSINQNMPDTYYKDWDTLFYKQNDYLINGLPRIDTIFTDNSGTEYIYDKSKLIKFTEESITPSTNITLNDIYDYNFLNNYGLKRININYQFVVGYKINISDIKKQNIPATTICALCHQKDDGNYNYEDFGIYKSEYDKNPVYLSKAMFFNEGTHEMETFGVCQQIKLYGTVLEQCNLVDSISTEASRITTPGKLNSGNPLKEMSKHIGKLTFCQPHVHGFSEVNGTNIQEGHSDLKDKYYNAFYCLPPALGNWGSSNWNSDEGEDTYGTAARSLMRRAPLYNLSLNTKNAIQYNSEFISTINYQELIEWFYEANPDNPYLKIYGINFNRTKNEEYKTDWQNVNPYSNDGHAWRMRKFTGFKGSEVAKFNRLLLNTMKNVYAYNPDYESMIYNVGKINVQDYIPSFNSNIICIDSNLDCNLNDYVYFGSVKFSDYLLDLQNKSNITIYDGSDLPDDRVEFIPNLYYCGSNEIPVLLTSLTYNTPVPEENINKELNVSEKIIIKHHTGNTKFFDEIPNKNLLYGWNAEKNSLIQLDVSNYTIDEDGNVNVNLNEIKENCVNYVTPTYNYVKNTGTAYTIQKEYLSCTLQGTNITLNDLIYEPNKEGHRLFMKNNLYSFYNSEDNRGKIYYRPTDLQTDYGYLSNDNQNKNCLCLFTGPCFTSLGVDPKNDPEYYDYSTQPESSSVATSLEPEDEIISPEVSLDDSGNTENIENTENTENTEIIN